MMIRTFLAAGAAIVAFSGCGDSAQAEGASTALASAGAADPEAPLAATCTVAAPSTPLPEDVHETSGLAQSRRDPDLFWTHNDAGNASVLFGIGSDGTIRQRVTIQGAELEDWEDIEAGPCASGTCLYLADIGDNDAEREHIVVYRIPEPAADATTADASIALRARYPDGAQDAESLIVSAEGDIYLVTKGRTGPIRLYKFPTTESSEVVTLALVKQLLDEPEDNQDRVTSATLSSDGRHVGIRSYANLYLYEAASLFGSGAAEPQVIDLAPAGQENGEALVVGDGGVVWVTSEADGKDSSPEWARLQCALD
jgi:hypothetical protein